MDGREKTALLDPPDAVAGVTRVEVGGLDAGYWRGMPVLRALTVHVHGPGWLHIGGPNGSGKSTLFEVLAGYLRPMTGTVEIGSREVRAGSPVPLLRLQRSEPSLVPGVTLSDHFRLYARRYGTDPAELVELAIRLGLREHLHKAPEALSTGSLKKAWFVCNSGGTEPIWCLDEPFNGVDAESTQIMAGLLDARATRGLVLMTAHVLPCHLVVRAAAAGISISAPFQIKEIRHDGDIRG